MKTPPFRISNIRQPVLTQLSPDGYPLPMTQRGTNMHFLETVHGDTLAVSIKKRKKELDSSQPSKRSKSFSTSHGVNPLNLFGEDSNANKPPPKKPYIGRKLGADTKKTENSYGKKQINITVSKSLPTSSFLSLNSKPPPPNQSIKEDLFGSLFGGNDEDIPEETWQSYGFN